MSMGKLLLPVDERVAVRLSAEPITASLFLLQFLISQTQAETHRMPEQG